MANDYRNESRRRSPLEKYGTPGTQYPTPNPYDVVITEEVTNRAQAFEPVLFGTPHPTVAAAVLCYQGAVKGNNSDKAPIRIYATPRLAQEPYNLVNGADDANDPAFPVFVRSYLLPRGYAPGTPGDPLTALIGLTLVSGGAGYGAALDTPGYGKIALAFSGGGGSGAAGFAEVAAGIVVAVVLTHTGTAYSSLPTVSVSGGSGAVIVAIRQPTAAKLISEEEQTAEEPYGGYFVRVTRTWETIPGKPLTSKKYDPESEVVITTTRTKKLLSAITPGSTFTPGTSVVTTEVEPIDSLFGFEVVTTIPDSPHNSEANAKIAEDMLPYGFPGYAMSYGEYGGITYTTDDFFGDGVGVRAAESMTVLHTRKTWWVIASGKPTLAFDEITPNTLVLNNKSYKVLHDEMTRIFGIYIITQPATLPSFTEYYGETAGLTSAAPPPDPFAPGTGTKWIGTSRVIKGGVENDGHPKRWRCTAVSVVMR